LLINLFEALPLAALAATNFSWIRPSGHVSIVANKFYKGGLMRMKKGDTSGPSFELRPARKGGRI
jgi:hypothetical protein